MLIGEAVLKIDYSDHLTGAQNRSAQHGLEVIFREVLEGLESWIIRGIGGDCYRFSMSRNPPSDPLSKLNAEPIHQVSVGIFGCAKNQFVLVDRKSVV